MYFEDIIEYFRSFQGESPFVGYSAIFIRFKYCNLMKVCKICDTLEKMKSDTSMKVPFKSVVQQLQHYNIQTLTFTGGEPTLPDYRKQIIDFMEYAYKEHTGLFKKTKVLIETNGFGIVELLTDLYKINDNLKSVIYTVWSPKFFEFGNKDIVDYNCQIFDKLTSIAPIETIFIKPVITLENKDKVDEFLDYIGPLGRSRVFIMPEGKTQKELEESSKFATTYALERNVNVSPRMHVSYNLP